jgi:hypothetical protein
VKDLPQPLPGDWLLPQIEGHRLRFVFSNYESDEQLRQQLRQSFGAVQMDCVPMPLREIANTLMQHRKRKVQ